MNKKNNYCLIIGLLVCVIAALSIYIPTLSRPWVFYDERVIYNEDFSQIPTTFTEIFEIINNFGLVNNFNSSNFLYTSNSVNRSNLLGIPFLLTVGYLFKLNPFLYHVLNLLFHVINTVIVYLIISTIFPTRSLYTVSITTLITLIWALHPVHVESILLSTNIGATLSYIVFFSLFLDFIKNRKRNYLKSRTLFLSILFLMPMLLNEYIIALPLILLTYSLIENKLAKGQWQVALKDTFTETKPYFIGLGIFLIYILFSQFNSFQVSSSSPMILFLERIFWLSPQIFIHYLSLIFYPELLSLDQSSHITLGNWLFDGYAVFCLLFLFSWLFVPFVIFKFKKDTHNLLLFSGLSFISLIPFCQILTPTYCLAAERYLYTPVFIIIFCITKLITNWITKIFPYKQCFIAFLSISLLLLTIRTTLRIQDWKDNKSLINSTINTSTNLLYKGLRTSLLPEIILQNDPQNTSEAKKYSLASYNYFLKAIKLFKKEKIKYSKIPLILQSYGLAPDSLIAKSAYYICYKAFEENDNYKYYLKFFKDHINNINELDPQSLELYANLLIKNNKVKKSKKIFEYAYKKFPTSPFILVSLIRFEKDIENNLPKAKKYLIEGMKLYPYSKRILFESLSLFQRENNLPDYAKHSYLYALRTHNKFHYHEALVGFLTLNQLNIAKKIIKKLMLLDQNDPRTFYLSSSYYIKTNELDKALQELNQAYTLIKNNQKDLQLSFNISYTLAYLYLKQGDLQIATAYAQEALKYAKDNSINLNKIKALLQ
ncbi:MAG: hypothetical protein HYY52_01525 [Candidatus Melainabacteria bacterium]|nr:hypothetical protein [Candidatus Melainabacteria bacterium]